MHFRAYAICAPQMTSETEAISPGEQTGLPYDIVTERLRTEPEHTPPEPEVSTDDAINANPVSVQIGGEWQTFPNTGTASSALSSAIPSPKYFSKNAFSFSMMPCFFLALLPPPKRCLHISSDLRRKTP